MVRLGLGYLEVVKASSREIYVSGQHLSQTKEIKTEYIVGESANTGFTRTLDLVASIKYGDLPAYIALGTGSTPKNPEDPYLTNEVARYPRSATSLSVGASREEKTFIEAWWVRQHEYSIVPSSDITVTEWGVSESGTQGSPLVAGGIFPSPLLLEVGQTYVFKYKTTTYYVDDSGGTNTRWLAPIQQSQDNPLLVHIPEFAEALMAGMTSYAYKGFTYNLYARNYNGALFATTAGSYYPGIYARSYQAQVTAPRDRIDFVFSGPSGANPSTVYMASLGINYYGFGTVYAYLYIYWAPYGDF